MSKLPRRIGREEIPPRFLALIHKTEQLLDFESKESPQVLQIYGTNNTMVSRNITKWLNVKEEEITQDRVAAVIATLCCNENVLAVGYILCAMRIDMNLEGLDADKIETVDDLKTALHELGIENIAEAAKPQPALLGGYETREGVWQAVGPLEIPDPEDMSTGHLGEWDFIHLSQEEVEKGRTEEENDVGKTVRGFFAGAKHFLSAAERW